MDFQLQFAQQIFAFVFDTVEVTRLLFHYKNIEIVVYLDINNFFIDF